MKGNKGEWSEIYVLIKILGDRKLIAGDKNLQQISSLTYPVIRIVREEIDNSFTFNYRDDFVVISEKNGQHEVPVNQFQKEALELLFSIKNGDGPSFSIPRVETFIRALNIKTIKAKSSSKTDIVIVIHDKRTGLTPELGFSIKSQLGGASTLLNASRKTNFTFRIDSPNLSEYKIKTINGIEGRGKIQRRVKEILANSSGLSLANSSEPSFISNLQMIDSKLPELLAKMVLTYYTTNKYLTSTLTQMIARENPLRFDLTNGHPFYSYKLKRFLTDIALGMMPSKTWTGEIDATGGYLIVKESGDVLCYHIYNRNEFEDYLFENTRFETPSSNKHGFGKIYEREGELYLNLNLQIRFVN